MRTYPIARNVFAALTFAVGLATAYARELSFEDRVRAQEAIERVRYAHQIGATAPFAEAVPRALLEKKVRTYLEQGAALEELWDTPLSAEILAREMERQAKRTRMPERLAELYAALGNDPFLVAECLVRPILVERLTRSFFAPAEGARAFAGANPRAIPGSEALSLPDTAERAPATCPPDDTWNNGTLDDAPDARSGHTAVWTGTEMIVWGGSVGDVATGSRYDPATDTWTATSRVDAPVGRISHTAIWTGSRMLIWGGQSGSSNLFTGGSYDPAADTWAPMSTVGAPVPRNSHAAVWTGTEMIVWGGTGTAGTLGTGARYDPGTNTWAPVSTVGAPTPRTGMTAVWSGQTMIVWGGRESFIGPSKVASGGRYDPASNTWQPTASLDAPIARDGHAAVWGGDRMFLWGGTTNSGDTNTGSRYDPVADAWLPTETIGAPPATSGSTAIWTGSKLVVWGGFPGSTGGGRYDPSTNLWQPVAAPSTPVGVSQHTAVWTGDRMIVWGGAIDAGLLGTGGRYDPLADQWTPTAAAPIGARQMHKAIWTGQQMILWGGSDGNGDVNTGDRYDPATDSWTPTSTLGAPLPRSSETVVWTGDQMIVWGGDSPGMDVGRRYDPIADAWSPVSSVGAPHKRFSHSAVWTGTHMIVWGGTTTGLENTGGRYDPASDTWTPTSLVGAPSKRSRHAAVWTGSRMVIWGGAGKTGGQYDPETDTWTATSIVGAPTDRDSFSAVWTGSRMVVWGGGNSAGLQDGGRYDPVADIWSPTSLVGAPPPRADHTAIWTGKHMVVWGGDGGSPSALLQSGGRYDPATDTWTPTSLVSAPVEREFHTAVWTGTAMVVWGGTATLTSGGAYSVTPSLDLDGDTFSVCDGDCNDAAPAVYPGAVEVCNGIDDDCDLAVDDGIPAPAARPAILTAKSGTATVLSWPAVPDATGYDAVKGNLGPLRNSGGNFTNATKACIADDVSATTIQDAEVPPPSGGLWFAVRAVSSCGGDGTYDEDPPGQQGSRDAEIGASAQACP